jgi:hypothetical protein
MSAVALEGDLGHFAPVEILQLLRLAQATGRLALERPGERADLFLEQGRLVHARTSARAVRTGEVLVHRGLASPAAVELALGAQARERSGARLGTLLVEAGAAPSQAVREAVHESVRRLVYGLVLWREGRFLFLPGERWDVAGMEMDLDLDRIILEALRLADESRAPR